VPPAREAQSAPDGDARRRLGLGSAATLVVANMIGVGVFTTSGFALADLGRPDVVLLAWALGGLVATCGALSYGALARQIPVSGGEYTFLGRVFHPLAGFLAGWISLLAGFTAPIAAAALGLQAYVAEPLGWEARPQWIGTAAILGAGAMHGLRLRAGVWLQNASVALKAGAIVVFVAVAARLLPPPEAVAPASPPPVDVGSFAVTLVWISFAYSGWNAAVYVAGEVRRPERNLARSLLLATLGVTAVYLALNAVFVYAAPVSQLAGRADIGAAAAEALGGPRLRTAISLLVGLALFTSVSAMIMAGPRVYARMAEDGLFPGRLGRYRDVPRAAVALQVALAVGVVWATGLVELLGYIGFTLGLSAAATVGALLVLRHRLGAERVPVPGHPWVPLLFVLVTVGSSLFLVVRAPWQAAAGLLTAATGVPVYLAFRRARRLQA